MSNKVNTSQFIGKSVKDGNKEIGNIVSFLIDSSGQVTDALLENKNNEFLRYPVERLQETVEGIILTSDVDKNVNQISEKYPVLKKKRRILEELAEKNEIPEEIYVNLAEEFDKELDKMKNEADTIYKDIDKQITNQEASIKTLQLARAYLVIEHGINNIVDETYRNSLMSILRKVKEVSDRKLSLLQLKEKVTNIFIETEISDSEVVKEDQTGTAVETESTTQENEQEYEDTTEKIDVNEENTEKIAEIAEEKPAITVHMTDE